MSIKSKSGFSLLELTIVLIVMTTLTGAIVPQMINGYLVKAANKTALDISAIQEAARSYYVDNNKWPDASVYSSPIATLKAEGYLPDKWNGLNPFINHSRDITDFNYHITSNASSVTVSTNVPNRAQSIIKNLLPMITVDPPGSGYRIYSSVPIPGAASLLPTGMIIAWASNKTPAAGFLLCDGHIYNVTDYPALAQVLGNTFGGDGINTFGVPNMQGKTIFGYQSGDINFGILGKSGGSKTMVGNGLWSSGHADTANWVNQVKIANGSLYGMTGAQTAEGVSTAVLNPYIALNYLIKT